MHISDRIYGEVEIKDAVILELIESLPLQRLKKISQDGAPHFIQPQRNITRFEHSIGVWYLSYLFERPIEEQVVCLLHDVPHTAFSHVIDFVFTNQNHDYHDHFFEQMVEDSEIPEILSKYAIDTDSIYSKENFPLLDNDLPDVSFDRLDYFMRDGYMFGVIPKVLINSYLNNIKSSGQGLYFTDVRMAGSFAVMFMMCSRLVWLDPTAHGSFYLLADVLKIALRKGYITQDDLFTDDEMVMGKLIDSQDDDISNILDKLTVGKDFVYASPEESDYYGANKPRVVDPYVQSDGKLQKVSDLVPGLRELFDDFIKRHKSLGVRQLN